jgi:hypothetical protein
MKMSKLLPVVKVLKGIFDEILGGTYTAGTLWSKDYVLNPTSHSLKEGYFDKGSVDTPYTPEELYWWAKCYVKYKTPNHHFYQSSMDIIAKYEGDEAVR